MGFSTSAAVVIFAASFLYITAIVYPLADLSLQRVINAEKSSYEIQYEKLNTKIEIKNMQSNGSDLDVTVYNNGSLVINSSKLNVLHDGVFTTSFTLSKEGVWTPKNPINVTIIGENSGRVKLITANGASDYAAT